jgi:AraC family transcriptional regulator of adaptative response / DNA-3-methyladenine glycosylase II
MTDVALAAGFGSVRRFNETFRNLYRRPPSELRRRQSNHATAIELHAAYQPPYDWDAMLRYLEARAIDGVEEVTTGVYRRTMQLAGVNGWLEVSNHSARHGLRVRISFPGVAQLPEIMQRVRQVFDLSADIDQIRAHLARDSALAPLVSGRPGLRAPGGWDTFELGVRAVLGNRLRSARRERWPRGWYGSVRASRWLRARVSSGMFFPMHARWPKRI